MNRPRKRREERIAFAKGYRVEFRCRYALDDEWRVWADDKNEPYWNSVDYEFRIHDPYRHLRDAIRAGEKIEFLFFELDGDMEWQVIEIGPDPENFKFTYPPNRYRIAPKAPKPDPMVYGYVRWSPLEGKPRVEARPVRVYLSDKTQEPIKIEVF